MQLTLFTDYALRLLMFLAERDGLHTTIRDVSAAHDISEDHLMKVVRRLAALGLVKATRGRHGGIAQARPAAQISVGEVVRAIEPFAPAQCFMADFDGACRLYPKCGLRSALEDAKGRFLEALDTRSLADIMGRRAAPIRLRKVTAPPTPRSLSSRRAAAKRPSAPERPKRRQALLRQVPADR